MRQWINEDAPVRDFPIIIIIRVDMVDQRVCKVPSVCQRDEEQWEVQTNMVFPSRLQPSPFESCVCIR
jgi:hypothetical protein